VAAAFEKRGGKKRRLRRQKLKNRTNATKLPQGTAKKQQKKRVENPHPTKTSKKQLKTYEISIKPAKNTNKHNTNTNQPKNRSKSDI